MRECSRSSPRCRTKTPATGAARWDRAPGARAWSRARTSRASRRAPHRTANTSRSCPTGASRDTTTSTAALRPAAHGPRRSTSTTRPASCWCAHPATPTDSRPTACSTRAMRAKGSGWWSTAPRTGRRATPTAVTDGALARREPARLDPLGNEGAQALRPPRYLSDSGRLFFDSADPLVDGEQGRTRQEIIGGQPVQVGVESVYEYEQPGTGSCAQAHGCVSLISSGTAQQESSFVDASKSGDDAFFVTSQPLVKQDTDTNFDLYDARVCTPQSPCLTSEGAAAEPCANSDACRVAQPPLTATGSSGTSAYTGPGNAPRVENPAGAKPPKPKPLTPGRAREGHQGVQGALEALAS